MASEMNICHTSIGHCIRNFAFRGIALKELKRRWWSDTVYLTRPPKMDTIARLCKARSIPLFYWMFGEHNSLKGLCAFQNASFDMLNAELKSDCEILECQFVENTTLLHSIPTNVNSCSHRSDCTLWRKSSACEWQFLSLDSLKWERRTWRMGWPKAFQSLSLTMP